MKRKPVVYLSTPGLVSCAGKQWREVYRAAIAGDCMRPGADGTPYLVGAIDAEALPPVKGAYNTRFLRIAQFAAEQVRGVVEKARECFGAEQIGVALGSCDNGSELSLAAHRAFFQNGAFPQEYRLEAQGAFTPARFIAEYFGTTGPVLAIATACASSASAIIKGAELIQSGICGAVIAGGVDIASPTVIQGFASLEAIDRERCNPFSRNRKGINLGEGAAFFVLSSRPLEAASFRLLGWGESADAYHITAPKPDGSGAAAAMRAALDMAGMSAADIGYGNLHGTGTRYNDQMEALAMAEVFGASQPLVSSTKPITGHTLGAAGALEIALCWAVLYQGRSGAAAVPIHCWDGVADAELPGLRFAGTGATVTAIRACMSNSFAFGGCNTSVILGYDTDIF
jgi:3-oxoacyl-[acyl-carrier-protein] synthase-1